MMACAGVLLEDPVDVPVDLDFPEDPMQFLEGPEGTEGLGVHVSLPQDLKPLAAVVEPDYKCQNLLKRFQKCLKTSPDS